MRWYFVMHPNIDITARIQAPTSEKARTAFLDYLERTGKIQRNQRQTFRSNMVVDKISNPGDVESSIELSYDYIEEPEPVSPEVLDLSQGSMMTIPIDRFSMDEEPVQQEQLKEVQMSPLQKLVLTGKV